jgi:hypothetical protein
MTALSAIVAALGTAAALGVWWLCRWLERRMDRDDRKDKGEFHD